MATAEFAPDFSFLRKTAESYEEYGRFQQHLELLEDYARSISFYAALASGASGETVVDVGAGTGILALMALTVGYKRAFLIEPSRKIASYAQYLLGKHGYLDRCTIIIKPLEQVNDSELPGELDLIISETISSLIVGFGSWDHLERLARRLSPSGRTIPSEGRLLAFFSEHDYGTRPSRGGLAFLRSIGIHLDLDLRTFRSGGNLFDKGPVNYELSSHHRNPFELLSFQFGREPFILRTCEPVLVVADARYTGITSFWEITLAKSGSSSIQLSSRDPAVKAWSPYFIPFRQPFEVRAGQQLFPRLKVLPLDAPYTYAFQILESDNELTNILYW
jgi:SAM-dependent methyltransferase